MGRPKGTSKVFGFVPPSLVTPKKPALAQGIPELEERVCACGCGRRFRVLPASRQRLASQGCGKDKEKPCAW